MSFFYIGYRKWIFRDVLWRGSILFIKIEWETLTTFRFQSDGGSIRMSAFEYFKIYKAGEFTIWYTCQGGELSWKYFRYQNIKNTSYFGCSRYLTDLTKNATRILKSATYIALVCRGQNSWQMTSAVRDDLCTLGSVEHISSRTLLHILYPALVSRPHFSSSINFLARVGSGIRAMPP